jgi:hypothetical protein
MVRCRGTRPARIVIMSIRDRGEGNGRYRPRKLVIRLVGDGSAYQQMLKHGNYSNTAICLDNEHPSRLCWSIFRPYWYGYKERTASRTV